MGTKGKGKGGWKEGKGNGKGRVVLGGKMEKELEKHGRREDRIGKGGNQRTD